MAADINKFISAAINSATQLSENGASELLFANLCHLCIPLILDRS